MSTENKKKLLLGFGAFAVVLIAVLAIWRPPAFRSEDASGSIGAVQKHHAPQITEKDVILGDETTRREQQIRYADFLNDAAKLNAIGAKITANNFEAASADMESMRGEARQRFYAVATEALAQAQALARANKEGVSLDAAKGIAELSAILQNGKLGDADMANVSQKFAAISEHLDGRFAAGRFAAGRFAADRAQAASREVASAFADMRANRDTAAAKMESATGELKALYGVSLADEAQYLSATEMESKAIAKAQAELKMMNAGANLAQANQKNAGSVAMGREIAAQADALEARAAKAMERQLGSLAEMASAFRDIDATLAAARGIAAEANEASAAAGGKAYDKAFANFYQAFAGTKAEFNAHANAGINAELAAVEAYLASVGKAGVKAADVSEMANVLAHLSERLAGNSALAAALADQQELAMRANKLSERAVAAR